MVFNLEFNFYKFEKNNNVSLNTEINFTSLSTLLRSADQSNSAESQRSFPYNNMLRGPLS